MSSGYTCTSHSRLKTATEDPGTLVVERLLDCKNLTPQQEILAAHAPATKIPQPPNPHDCQSNHQPNRPRNPLHLPQQNKPTNAARTPRPRQSLLQTRRPIPRTPRTPNSLRNASYVLSTNQRRRDLRRGRLQDQDSWPESHTASGGSGYETQARG